VLLQLDVVVLLLLLALVLALLAAVKLLLLSPHLARRGRAPALDSPLALASAPSLSRRGMRLGLTRGDRPEAVAGAQDVHGLGRHLGGRLGGRRLGRRADKLRRDLWIVDRRGLRARLGVGARAPLSLPLTPKRRGISS
tara:strand:+ start:2037 stop:2453 length:417 start_codon:yes stop_codon:yes gene_type:complete